VNASLRLDLHFSVLKQVWEDMRTGKDNQLSLAQLSKAFGIEPEQGGLYQEPGLAGSLVDGQPSSSSLKSSPQIEKQFDLEECLGQIRSNCQIHCINLVDLFTFFDTKHDYSLSSLLYFSDVINLIGMRSSEKEKAKLFSTYANSQRAMRYVQMAKQVQPVTSILPGVVLNIMRANQWSFLEMFQKVRVEENGSNFWYINELSNINSILELGLTKAELRQSFSFWTMGKSDKLSPFDLARIIGLPVEASAKQAKDHYQMQMLRQIAYLITSVTMSQDLKFSEYLASNFPILKTHGYQIVKDKEP